MSFTRNMQQLYRWLNSGTRNASRRSVSLAVETLEERRVPASSIPDPYNGVLTIKGDLDAPNYADKVELSEPGTSLQVTLNGVSRSFPDGKVSKIVVCTGEGDDTITVQSNLPAALIVSVEVDAGNGIYNRLVVNEVTPRDKEYTVTSSSVMRSLMTPINFKCVGELEINGNTVGRTFNVNCSAITPHVTINAGSAGDTFNVGILQPVRRTIDPIIQLNGQGGVNRLNCVAGANYWHITGNGNGVINNQVAFTSVANISNLGGGAMLSYARYPAPIMVDLTLGMFTGFATAAGFSHVWGSAYDDTIRGNAEANVLIGGAGKDCIYGGAGRDLIIGDYGEDKLYGESAGDILIAGHLFYGAYWASTGKPALDWYSNDPETYFRGMTGILAEWNSTRDYATRIANLRAGVAVPVPPGAYTLAPVILNASTVYNDYAYDELYGDSSTMSDPDPDWFWGDNGYYEYANGVFTYRWGDTRTFSYSGPVEQWR